MPTENGHRDLEPETVVLIIVATINATSREEALNTLYELEHHPKVVSLVPVTLGSR